MPELAFVNGKFGPVAEATVSIEDRGFQFGDGVYEVIAVYGGRLFLLEPHMRRLRRSAAAIGLEYDFDAHPLEPVIAEGLRRCGFTEAMVYLQITRGAAPRSHLVPAGLTPTVVMTFKPLPAVASGLRDRGVRVMTAIDTRWARCSIKAVTLLPNVLAKREAMERGFEDAIFVTEAGEVRECTSSNVFVAKGGRLKFPPRTEAILHGVTQGFLLECAAAIDVTVEEAIVHIDELRAADEVFMSGTSVEALGITAVDDAPVADGKVGPITRRLYAEFRNRVRKLTAKDEEGDSRG